MPQLHWLLAQRVHHPPPWQMVVHAGLAHVAITPVFEVAPGSNAMYISGGKPHLFLQDLQGTLHSRKFNEFERIPAVISIERHHFISKLSAVTTDHNTSTHCVTPLPVSTITAHTCRIRVRGAFCALLSRQQRPRNTLRETHQQS